jgi:protein SCO1/2
MNDAGRGLSAVARSAEVDAGCGMRAWAGSALVVLAIVTAACSGEKRYPLTGQVVAVNAERQELTVKHQDIRGFMPGMTMPFKVKDAQQVADSRPGDLITATLVVEESAGYLEDIRKTGEAPLPADLPKPPPAPMIEPGAEVPAATFVDESGQERRLADFRGRTLAVTFIYTRCPVPDFCPLMDRHFAAVQKALKADAELASRVHLLSVSFDPDFDTPEVLRAHATRVGADPAIWSYVTGTREGIDAFAAAFGVSIMREDGTMEEIIHNLRTAVIGPEGRLVEVFNGNDWQPAQLVASIRAADARR